MSSIHSTLPRKSHDYRDVMIFLFVIVFRFENAFRPLNKPNAGVFKHFRFEECFRKAPFPERLVWTMGLTREIKLCFSNRVEGGRHSTINDQFFQYVIYPCRFFHLNKNSARPMAAQLKNNLTKDRLRTALVP